MPSTKAKYETFLINNVSTIQTLESSLRSFTWFLPGRFKDAELASEALTALLNVVTLYHDTLLARVVKDNPAYRPLIPTSLHNRFTKAWSEKSPVYKWAARSLEAVRFTELVVEMLLRRKVSEKTKWRAIILLETIKTVLRLIVLKTTRRPLVSPLVPEREFDPAMLQDESSTLTPSFVPLAPSATPDHLRNNTVPLSTHPLLSPENKTRPEDFLSDKALTPNDIKSSLSLVPELSSAKDWIAEVLYIIRPLTYVSLLVADRKKVRTTNRALIVVLVLELFSRNLRRVPPPSSSLERSEHARRDKDMLWYLLRGSIWQGYTRPKVEGLIERTSNTPLLGVFGAFAKDWLPLIDDYYYYTAL